MDSEEQKPEITVPCHKISIEFDFKKFNDVEIPPCLNTDDAIRQYVGIWKIFLSYILGMKAKKVLEFGTREGYSTKLFSQFLRFTEGHLWTVDLNPHKIPKEEAKQMDNVTFLQMNVLHLDVVWKDYVDILYIDDWHNSFHLYEELDRYSRLAKVIMIHDVIQDWEKTSGIMNGLISWCQKEFIPYTIYPLNACGLAVIEMEKYRDFYK